MTEKSFCPPDKLRFRNPCFVSKLSSEMLTLWLICCNLHHLFSHSNSGHVVLSRVIKNDKVLGQSSIHFPFHPAIQHLLNKHLYAVPPRRYPSENSTVIENGMACNSNVHTDWVVYGPVTALQCQIEVLNNNSEHCTLPKKAV